MSSTSDLRTQAAAPKASFRLSMLLYDQRYRSITIQIVFLFALMLGIAWLVDNTITTCARWARISVFISDGRRVMTSTSARSSMTAR